MGGYRSECSDGCYGQVLWNIMNVPGPGGPGRQQVDAKWSNSFPIVPLSQARWDLSGFWTPSLAFLPSTRAEFMSCMYAWARKAETNCGREKRRGTHITHATRSMKTLCLCCSGSSCRGAVTFYASAPATDVAAGIMFSVGAFLSNALREFLQIQHKHIHFDLSMNWLARLWWSNSRNDRVFMFYWPQLINSYANYNKMQL